MTKVYQADIGTQILLDTGQSLAGATSLAIQARKPDGTTATWTATASGTSVSYTTISGDLDQAGAWLLQAHVVLPSGTWRGETAKLVVYSAFE